MLFRSAARQDYEGFYTEEMRYRELMGYPPAAQLLAVLVTGGEEGILDTAAGYLKEFVLRAAGGREFQVIGPASPSVGKINDVYRRVIYLKSSEYHVLTVMKNYMEQYIEMNKGFQTLRIQFDFNPVNIF